MPADQTTSISVSKSRNGATTAAGMEAERGERGRLRRRRPGIAQVIATQGVLGAGSTCRPGREGRLDQVTGLESPAQVMVTSEVRLSLSEGIEQCNWLWLLCPCRWVACPCHRRGLCRLADVLKDAAHRDAVCHKGDDPHVCTAAGTGKRCRLVHTRQQHGPQVTGG